MIQNISITLIICLIAINANAFMLDNPYVSKVMTLKGQLHAHSSAVDGGDTPADLEAAYKQAGFDFISLTDHEHYTPDPDVAGITHIGAVEETASKKNGGDGHIGAINVSAEAGGLRASVGETIATIIDDGGIAIMNHPNYSTGSWPAPWTDTELENNYGYTAISIYNSIVAIKNAEDKWDAILSNGRQVWGVAVDDCHDITWDAFNKGWVMVHADANTKQDIMEGLSSGNFYSSTGATLSISVSGRTITATTDASSTIEFIKTGGADATPNATEATTAIYTVMEADEYIRVRVTRDLDGAMAWSNPIFVRNPLAFDGLTLDGVMMD